MKRSLVFHICGVLCSILLLSPSAICLSLQRLSKQNIPEGNRGFDGTVNSYSDNILPPTPSALEKETNNTSSYVTSSDDVLAASNVTQNNSRLLSNSAVDEMSPETTNLGFIIGDGPTGQSKTLIENGILTTAVSTTDYIPSVASRVKANNENDEETFSPTEETKMDIKDNTLENSSQVNTIEMLTTNPRTSIVDADIDHSTISSNLADKLLATINTEIPSDPTTMVNTSNVNVEQTIPELEEDWDDTKVTTQSPKSLGRAEFTTIDPKHHMEEEHVEAAMVTTSSGMTVISDDKSVFNVTDNSLITESGVRVSPDSLRSENSTFELNPILNVTVFTPQPSVEVNQSQDFSAADTGVKQLTTDTSEKSNVTVTAAILMNVTSQDTTREPEVTDKVTYPVMDNSTLHMEIPQNESNDGPSAADLNPSSKDEEFLATSTSSVPLMATTEAESTSIVSTVTSMSHVSVDIPPTRRIITTTASYGLDRIESEERDEEDEDEEDDDDDDDEADEDDDEEEEDDNKDNDSESSEKDSDGLLFTLPGLSSQEPLEDDGNVALIEGAAYPVPDTMEWEQQNQGLVRSWMEKLKDKAGYMSGMLVPVGVGIVGALFILGVLYSIKIMNRRRRNVFKRHKRKQREFNSMQDRVMLLADSSEDEF
ncbi:armadillo-like helical domain-containing protein 4 isoform X1 [Engystomops pustulosus]|uniref:armadillo-like helical domain-containing protein 4 isoform X1 n=1 Tax=Engystomops pustulosus TaxID=76066 RepID=UPI003AFAD1F7